MKQRIKQFTVRCLPRRAMEILRDLIPGGWARLSYSQEGEDMVLRRYFDQEKSGFYVDVGAHHPKRFSNTFYFYCRGWRGINIDAMPGAMKKFRRQRNRDVNLEVAIAVTESELVYYMFDEAAFNSLSRELVDERLRKVPSLKLLGTRKVRARPLASVLQDHVSPGQRIDFLSLDVEGLDLQVLRSNDWNRFRPKLIVVELIGSSLRDIETNEISEFLLLNGYQAFAKCFHSVFFEDARAADSKSRMIVIA